MPELYAVFAIPIRLPHHTKVRPPCMAPSRHTVFLSVSEMGTFRQLWQRGPVRRLFIAKVPSSGSGVGRDGRFRRKRKRGFMDCTAYWAGDLGVQFHLFLVVAGHPFQESCKRWTAVLAEVGSVLVGHSCSPRDAKPVECNKQSDGWKAA